MNNINLSYNLLYILYFNTYYSSTDIQNGVESISPFNNTRYCFRDETILELNDCIVVTIYDSINIFLFIDDEFILEAKHQTINGVKSCRWNNMNFYQEI